IELGAVRTPARLGASIIRHLQLRTGTRERLQVDLGAARLGGAISDPFAVRRELRAVLVVAGDDDGNELSVSFEGERPSTRLRRIVDEREDQETAILGPIAGAAAKAGRRGERSREHELVGASREVPNAKARRAGSDREVRELGAVRRPTGAAA